MYWRSLPAGIVVLEASRMVWRKVSSICEAKSSGSVGKREAKEVSVRWVYLGQSALERLMKVCLRGYWFVEGDGLRGILMSMGRWSELRVVDVDHSEDRAREAGAKETSGEVGRPEEGSLVGVSSLRMTKLEEDISSESNSPRGSGVIG